MSIQAITARITICVGSNSPYGVRFQSSVGSSQEGAAETDDDLARDADGEEEREEPQKRRREADESGVERPATNTAAATPQHPPSRPAPASSVRGWLRSSGERPLSTKPQKLPMPWSCSR